MSEQIGLVIGVIVSLIAVALVLSYGVYIFYQTSQVIYNLNMPGGSEANLTAENVITNTWSVFSLMSPVPLLMGAGAIITVLLAAFLWVRSR